MGFRLKPTYIVGYITEMNLENLKDDGVKGLLFDLDNTLMAPKSGVLKEDISGWLELVRKDFKIAIVSNNPHEFYIEQAKEVLGCPVYGKAKKPRRSVAVKAMRELNLLPSEIAIVGDRPLTDILLGQRMGSITVLVDPLIKHQESNIVKFLRKLERLCVKSAQKTFSVKQR